MSRDSDLTTPPPARLCIVEVVYRTLGRDASARTYVGVHARGWNEAERLAIAEVKRLPGRTIVSARHRDSYPLDVDIEVEP